MATIDPGRPGEDGGRAPLGPTQVIERGEARIKYRIDTPRLRQLLSGTDSGRLTVPAEPVASRIQAPIVQQVFPNNCETAALSMLLATRGVDIDQRTLQRQLPRSAPLDPTGAPNGGRVWGDPEQGFVGRVQGGGPAGGYGVYEQPILDLASSHADRIRSER